MPAGYVTGPSPRECLIFQLKNSCWTIGWIRYAVGIEYGFLDFFFGGKKKCFCCRCGGCVSNVCYWICVLFYIIFRFRYVSIEGNEEIFWKTNMVSIFISLKVTLFPFSYSEWKYPNFRYDQKDFILCKR